MAKETPRIIFTRAEIETTVARMAKEIRSDYSGKWPILIAVLKGSFMFTADLVRHLDFPLEIDFVAISSYGSGTESSGKAIMVQGLYSDIKGRDVLVIEDIIDTGRTMAFLLPYLKEKGASSVKICALVDKPSRRQIPIKIQYTGFTVSDKFIVGYGIDWDEKYRCLPDICCVDEET
jgi:hypoxanthine phosphoribosyltransferase